jgi:hypothetical protein
MPTIPTFSLRPARLFGLMVPLAVAIGVAVLIMLPNLMMHASPDGHHAASPSAAAAVESSPIMR